VDTGQSSAKEPLTDEPAEPADLVIGDISNPNPTLYFHANTANGHNYRVDSRQPKGQWQPVEQFCSYLATYWLVNKKGKGALKFANLSEDEQKKAVGTLAEWGFGGLAAQEKHALQALGGSAVGTDKVQTDASQKLHSPGTRIWLGNNGHAVAAFVHKKFELGADPSAGGGYTVYDPNSGKVEHKDHAAFAKYAKGFSKAVVAS
jgi:hypothetical protein